MSCLRALLISSLLSIATTQTGGAQSVAPASSEMNVERLFATSCGWCHQGGGRVQGRGPKLAGITKSDEEIIRQIKNGKPPGMPAFGKSFNDEQIKAIITYIRNLKDTP